MKISLKNEQNNYNYFVKNGLVQVNKKNSINQINLIEKKS